MKRKVFALVDCDNFYVSCERVFNPKLKGKPVVVLSNNDGCVISRSDEVKEIGIPMGAPIFQYENLVKKYKIELLSSNFTLYGDMSRRVMETIKTMCPDIEIYSIDEAFLSFDRFKYHNINEYIKKIRERVLKWTGIPISIGVGETKTLAKIATKIAKKDKSLGGIFNLLERSDVDEFLKKIEIRDVWGIGPSFEEFLKKNEIITAYDFKYLPYEWVKKHLKTLGLRILLELNGIPCIEMEFEEKPKKSISTSRSFGKDLTDFKDLKEAISSFITIAAEKLRKEKQLASIVTVFLMSNPFKETEKYFKTSSFYFPRPTANTSEIIEGGINELKKIYKSGILYKKAGVILQGLIPEEESLFFFFDPIYKGSREEMLMKTIDTINKKFGRDTIKPLSNGINKPYMMRQLRRSKNYTTRWDEIPIVKSG
ncbi:MAG: Y-family DNA polymerase [Caldisericia bacterium]|jgi:DNA polymerase V|nr:Y-family DNA polymerase [Caldisericia bacterium]